VGKSPQKKALLEFAHQLSAVTHIPIDRLAKRSRDCLLCWFCENWYLLSPHVPEVVSTAPSSPLCSSPSLMGQQQTSIRATESVGFATVSAPTLTIAASIPNSQVSNNGNVSVNHGIEATSYHSAFDSTSEAHCDVDNGIVSEFYDNEFSFWTEDSAFNAEDIFCPLWN